MKRPFHLCLLTTLALGVFVGTVLAEDRDYLGSGKFTTNNLYRCYMGTTTDSNGSYITPAQNASAKWSATTDINMYYSCTSYKIVTKASNYGDSGWVGFAYICEEALGCGLGVPYDNNFTSCEARVNTFHEINYSQVDRQHTFTHELGHCYSLGHRDSDATSVMKNGKTGILEPNARDKELINARY